jgi:hypothetical protein
MSTSRWVRTLQSSEAQALKGLSLAREYMNYRSTTLRDFGSVDPEWLAINRATRSIPVL